MSNEGLKLETFEDKMIKEDNQEYLLLEEIRKLEEQKRKLEENIAELNVENEKLRNDLIHDSLTGLNTRKYLEERVEEIISSFKNPEREKRKEGFRNFSILFCDIDNFKKINDTLGHKGGDAVLKRVSEIITQSVRNSDMVSRWGGEEIAVGLFGTDEGEAVEKAEGIRTAIEKGMKDMNVTISIGVAFCKEDPDTDSIIRQADEAMYFAKNNGKNNVKTYDDIFKDKLK